MKMQTEVRVLTLNCWGIRFVSKDRVARMTAIAEKLATGNYDFVFLQEVWTTEDYERIKTRTGDVLPYSHYFFSGVIGAGICIFSKSPIKSAFFHQWAVNGYVHKIQHGDWFEGKGIRLVEVDHRGLKINLYTAHLHAEYNRRNDEYLAHRITQAFDTAQFIQVTSRNADAVIVGGDLNTKPGDLAYRLLVRTADLTDTFNEVHSKASSLNMPTCDTVQNSYTPRAVLKANPEGKRLDYVLYRWGKQNVTVKANRLGTPWPDRVPEQPFSYSDHEAVESDIQIMKSANPVFRALSSSKELTMRKDALEEAVAVCDQALRTLQSTKNKYIVLSLAMFVVFCMTAGLELQGYLAPLISVFRLATLLAIFFSIFMSVIWHRMEVQGILAGKLSMLIELGKPLEPDTEVLPEKDIIIAKGKETWSEVDPTECLP